MSLYPSTPAPSYSYILDSKWNTVISKYDTGKEQRRQKQIQTLFDVSLKYDLLEPNEIDILWNFYRARRGSWASFYFYSIDINTWEDMYVGIGDGVTPIFDLPGKNTSSHSIYVNGALQGGTYSILTGGGAENADRVSFNLAPLRNNIITCTITGYMRIKCRFEQDKMSRELFTAMLYRSELKLIGLPV